MSARARERAVSVRSRRWQRGYTVVELMMALAVMSVGVAGVIAMQGVTAASNRHAKSLAVATHIAQSWLDMLASESSLWVEDNRLERTEWLVEGNINGIWFRPEYSEPLNFGPAFDALGNAVSLTDIARDTQYCVDLRLSQLRLVDDGNDNLVRAEVRVFWRREDAVLLPATAAPAHACALESVAVSNDTAGNMFHFLYMSSAVRQQGRGDTTTP
jgi:prepilin-type N-terminal cleavage/methylation domain-containing protein